MAPSADPYRILGLDRSASLDDVKRAYRRLAKANHPDAAGEAALPRFLAIQAAYDQIAGPDARPGSRPGSTGTPRRPWEADADRSEATHRAYGGRTRPRPGSRPGPRPRPASAGEGRTAGTGAASDRDAPGSDRADRPSRSRKKATLGSTSYDGVDAETFEPDWGGASWYGTTSGTYWTLNPREYADPRKHGPEYQARARRAGRRPMGSRPGSPEPAVEAASETVETASATLGTADAAPPRDPAPPRPTHVTASWWETSASGAATGPASRTTAGPPRSTTADPPRSTTADPPRSTTAPSPDEPRGAMPSARTPDISSDAILDAIRAWLDDGRPGLGGRIGRAVVGWAPIALGIGWLAGEVTGCGRFSADCHPAVAPLSWAAQVAALVLLILILPFARIASIATVATLAAIIPASVLLLATSDPDSVTAGRVALGGLMSIAWTVGIAYGAYREVGRHRSGPAPPVS
jgi:DnaJ-like protein